MTNSSTILQGMLLYLHTEHQGKVWAMVSTAQIRCTAVVGGELQPFSWELATQNQSNEVVEKAHLQPCAVWWNDNNNHDIR